MQWSLFLLILMGQCSSFTCRPYKYHFVNENKNWEEAQTYCREHYTDLATVYDKTDMDRLCRSAKNQTEEAWIGLYNEPQSKWTWHWSLPGVEYKHHDKWASGQPNNRNDEYFGAIMKHAWHDILREDTDNFICYDAKNVTKKFYLIEEKKTWPEAQSYCREHHTDLVSGLDQLEDKNLISEIGKSSNRNGIWLIGLFRDTWRWSDGSSFSFRNWKSSSFNYWPEMKTCAVTMLDATVRWQHGSCEDKKPFFCYDDKMILIQLNKSWDEALDYCREEHKDLVSITNLDEQRWVQEKAKNASTDFVWLGLRYTCTLGFWFWVSDEVVSYKNWASDGGSDECDMSGAMRRGGEHKWHKKDDANKFNFICSKS